MFTNKQISLVLSVLFFCWRYKLEFGATEIVSVAQKFNEFLDGKKHR